MGIEKSWFLELKAKAVEWGGKITQGNFSRKEV